ncbi:DUF6161 domain-containing protein [Pseudophaeobacter sp.]|uniref:DUF6161 domain-containing protein n=1 Tax=Pseudophaeobacter sp. TaxID=1971739 RepID=UPI0032996881
MDIKKPNDPSRENENEAFAWLSKDTSSLTGKLAELATGSMSAGQRQAISEDVAQDVRTLHGVVSKAAEVYGDLQSTQAELYVDLKQTKAGQAALQEQLEEARQYASTLTARATKELDIHHQQTLADFEKGLEVAQAAFTEQQAIRAPVELWKEKQTEHVSARKVSFSLFVWGLVAAAAFILLLIFLLVTQAELISTLLAPVGCDPANPATICSGFSLKGALVAGGVLALFTLLLWFIRLQMKLYLAERHLALDARERLAFAQSYLGLVREGDVSEEAKEQRALVYAALFRPASDGTVKDEGSLDPSVTAALAKFLMKP